MSPRIAGDDPGYTFRLCRFVERDPETVAEKLEGKKIRTWIPTDDGFEFISASTFLGEVMGKPASAMAWWGYRIGLDAIAEALDDDVVKVLETANDPDGLEAFLKERGVNPNMKTEEASDRGNEAHGVLEHLAAGARDYAEAAARREEEEHETRYGWAVIEWWDDQIAPHLESGLIRQVLSEVRIWYVGHGWDLRWAGTFDLAIDWAGDLPGWPMPPEGGWEIVDLKTHKPAAGFTKEGKGCAYVSDVAQIRAYRMGWEWMGRGKTIGQRVVVARDRAYRGKTWLQDTREVPDRFVLRIREAFNDKEAFERGAA